MTNWPQIPISVAEVEYRHIISSAEEPKPRNHHPDQIYSPVGGRAGDETVQRLIDDLETVARQCGYSDPDATGGDRIRFDREAAPILQNHMDISWADAGNRRLWSFVSVVALPHLTHWRFGIGNEERWIASDLTRHTWARLWWQAVVFEGDEEVLLRLSESDLNQLLERRTIGGDPRLVRTFARAILEETKDGGRRNMIRDATKRLRRFLAFVDPLTLNDTQIRAMCALVIEESKRQLA